MVETYTGEVRNGMVVFDEGTPPLPEGTKVKVEPAEKFKVERVVLEKDIEELRELLLSLAGTAVGLPPDMAAQHDHYLHGQPKR